jgi:patatin-like phospholipase/acyl hydrolase
MADKKLLLSIDGGGLRGILPVCMLVELERQTQKRARDVFSFAAGTSTGSVIASGIAAGIPAEAMLNLYLRRARDVFYWHPLDPFWRWARRLLFKGHFFSSQPLRRVLAEEAGEAESWDINSSPIDILVTAKRVNDGMPWYFVKDKPSNSGRTGKLRLVDCVTASCVVPTYHDPWTVPEEDPPAGHRPVGRLVDGGVGVAGNPVYQACVEAFCFTDEYVPAETIVVSLGTGHHVRLDQNPDSILDWLGWTIGELLDSAGEQQTELVQRHFPEARHYRLQPPLPRPIGGDSVKDVNVLFEIGQRFAATIDWPRILSGDDERFLITDERTLPREYVVTPPLSETPVG